MKKGWYTLSRSWDKQKEEFCSNGKFRHIVYTIAFFTSSNDSSLCCTATLVLAVLVAIVKSMQWPRPKLEARSSELNVLQNLLLWCEVIFDTANDLIASTFVVDGAIRPRGYLSPYILSSFSSTTSDCETIYPSRTRPTPTIDVACEYAAVDNTCLAAKVYSHNGGRYFLVDSPCFRFHCIPYKIKSGLVNESRERMEGKKGLINGYRVIIFTFHP